MEQISLTFDSIVARQQNSTNKPENFVTLFKPSIKLNPKKKYETALVKLQGSYSWRNIQADYNNNLARYSPDGGTTWKDIIFTDGVYTYTDIKNTIRATMKENNDFTVVDGVDTYYFDLQFSFTSFLIGIQLTNNYKLEIVSQGFGDLIGYNVGILASGSYEGVRLPNINRSLDKILVHSSLCLDSYVNGISGDVIYSFATATLSRGYPFTWEPYNLQYFPITSNVIDSVRIYWTTQTGEILNLNGIDTSVVLHIREVMEK